MAAAGAGRRGARPPRVRGAVQLEVSRGKSPESISQSPAQAARPARVPKPRRHADSHLYSISGGCCQTGSGWLLWAPKGGCHIPPCAPQQLPLPRAGRCCWANAASQSQPCLCCSASTVQCLLQTRLEEKESGHRQALMMTANIMTHIIQSAPLQM